MTEEAGRPHRIGIIGLGKIAQDQHLRVIRANPAFELAAIASQRGLAVEGVPQAFRSHSELLADADLDAVAICTPPQVRHAIAREALLAGKHVLLEKPPAATLSELADLEDLARRRGLVLFTTWHSQYDEAVEEARRRLADATITRLFVDWKEDVRKWHPGQAWIWRAGGFGVFDPGINALSILTRILPQPLFVRSADLFFPANADAPIAADLAFASAGSDGDFRAEFDWRQQGGECWEIEAETRDRMRIRLSGGGARLDVDGETIVSRAPDEYERIYRHFDALLTEGARHVDDRPLRLVADAFLNGRRIVVEAFEDARQD